MCLLIYKFRKGHSDLIRCKAGHFGTPMYTREYGCIYRRWTEQLSDSLRKHVSSSYNALIKFPFKRKGLPSCSASLPVKAKKYTCASAFPTLPRLFVQTLNMIKHFIVNLKKTIVN